MLAISDNLISASEFMISLMTRLALILNSDTSLIVYLVEGFLRGASFY
jgi:hypothetical protein